LVQSGKLATDLETIDGLRDEDGTALVLRFYRLMSHRYWKRQAGEIAQLVHRIGELGRAIGAYGEILCDAALGAARFVEAARDVREWNGRRWDRTEHDLDRVYVCDGIAYGCEIKNTLKYFPPEERRVKQEMCALMGIKPLFVVRWLPKSHMFETIKAGGFAILFETQLYPVGQEAFAREVRERLGLPVGVTATFPAVRCEGWSASTTRSLNSANWDSDSQEGRLSR
jgi:hypothetical protein